MSLRERLALNDFLRKHPEIPASGDCVLIIVEGEKTELLYLHSLCERLGLSAADVETVFNGSDPVRIVEEAVRRKEARNKQDMKRTSVSYKEVWCVFDTEEVAHARRSRMLAACQLARENGIHLALSAPCFEVWMLLHFRDFDLTWVTPEQTSAAFTTVLRNREILTTEQNYDKGSFDFDSLHADAAPARKRAKARRTKISPQDTGHWAAQVVAWLADGRPEKELGESMPATDVDLLVESLNWKATPRMRLFSP